MPPCSTSSIIKILTLPNPPRLRPHRRLPIRRSMKSASVNAAGRSARMAMAAMSFARRLLNGARMAPRPGAIAQSTHVWRFTKFQPAICRLRSFCGCGEPPRRNATLLHGGFARRVLTARRLRSCYSSEYRTPELVHPVEGLDGNCNFSRTTGIVA